MGTDIALANAMANVIIDEDLHDKEFIERATKNFEAYRDKVSGYTPEYAEQITGVPADDIREVARMYATADKAILNWTLGITEHHNGADGVFALIGLGLLTGHVGKYGSGLNPLRGQNNVQGGGDMGALPDKMVGGWHWDDPEAHELFEEVWGSPLPEKVGKHQPAMMDAVERGEIRCMYVIGENPAQSDADEHYHDELFGGLDLLVVQDIMMTKTARMADVVLPAAASWAETEGTVVNSERRVQRVHRVVDPPGEARADEWIVQDIAKRMGYDWGFETAEDVWNEVRRLAPKFSGISYERLEKHGGIQWPCLDGSFEEISDNTPKEQLGRQHKGRRERRGRGDHHRRGGEAPGWHQVPARPSQGRGGRESGPLHPRGPRGPGGDAGRGVPLPVDDRPPPRLPQHGHDDPGLQEGQRPEELLEICEEDAAEHGIEDGDLVRVSSRRGTVER